MTVHASLEQLSSYLDAELAERERVDLEGHLADCPSCRGRLAGLRGVVARLERLEQQAPPQDLPFMVERRIALDADRVRLKDRLEETLKTFFVQPTLMPIFGLVVALALILYLFSFGIAKQQAGGTRVVVPPPIPTTPSESATRMIEGRSFELQSGLWVEEGTDSATLIYALDLRGVEVLPAELAPFAELEMVQLWHEGQVVRVSFP